MSTYFILLDAFRSDYISDEKTPNIYELAKTSMYIKKIEQSLGYCERSEIFTGKNGLESKFVTAIKFERNTSDYPSLVRNNLVYQLDCFLVVFQKIIGGGSFASRLRKFIRRRFLKILYFNKAFKMNIYEIPAHMLSNFSLSEDLVDHRIPNALKTESLFDYMAKTKKTYDYGAFTSLSMTNELHSDEQRFQYVEKMAEKQPCDLHLVYVTASDKYGHLYGPSSKDFLNELKNLDQRIGEFIRKIRNLDKNAKFVILGDHGMTDVTGTVDLKINIVTYFDRFGLKAQKDYQYFLDSTICRVWFGKHVDKSIKEGLSNLDVFMENGTWLNEDNALAYSVCWPNREYGDCFWLANPGVLISPDFFNGTYIPKGMHGYDPRHKDSYGMCIYDNGKDESKVVEKMKLCDVYAILKSSLREF